LKLLVNHFLCNISELSGNSRISIPRVFIFKNQHHLTLLQDKRVTLIVHNQALPLNGRYPDRWRKDVAKNSVYSWP
jgi:hypothetical protein